MNLKRQLQEKNLTQMDKTYVEFSEKRLKNTQAFKNWW